VKSSLVVPKNKKTENVKNNKNAINTTPSDSNSARKDFRKKTKNSNDIFKPKNRMRPSNNSRLKVFVMERNSRKSTAVGFLEYF